MTAPSVNRSSVPRGPIVNSLKSGQLPRFIELYLVIAALAVSAGILVLLGRFNVVGELVVAAIVYLVVVGVLSSIVENRRKATDRVVRGLVTVAFLLAMAPLISTLATVVIRGIGEVNWTFITTSTAHVFNPKTLVVSTSTGALQGIVGTLIITGIAAVISVPIGILTAIYLVEYAVGGNWLSRTVTFLVDVMTGIPSIVAGLFSFALFSLLFGPKAVSGFAASVALCVLMIPIVVRSSEEMLKLVSMELREASYALGVSKFATITKIVLPTAIAGLVTGVTLAIARVIGETAPIFIAASFTDNLNTNAFFGAMSSLATMALTGYKFPSTNIQASIGSAWGAALLLIIIVVVLNLIARIVARVFAPKGLR